jgi:hypothetical protein
MVSDLIQKITFSNGLPLIGRKIWILAMFGKYPFYFKLKALYLKDYFKFATFFSAQIFNSTLETKHSEEFVETRDFLYFSSSDEEEK